MNFNKPSEWQDIVHPNDLGEMSGITPTWEWASNNARINNEYVREAIAEFLGTMLLCFYVVGSGLGDVLKPGGALIPTFGTVFGLMTCIIIFGGVSGAHINPAVSFGLSIAGKLKWQKFPIYVACQILGGTIGSLIAYTLIQDNLRYTFGIPDNVSIPEWDESIDSKVRNQFAIYTGFSPRPATYLATGIVTEIILTCILLMAVLAVTDKRNMKIPEFLLPFMFALIVTALALGGGHPTGALLNPARDMAPRLAALILGWKTETCFLNSDFKGNEQQWWMVGIFGPAIGAAIGVFLYIFAVGAQLPPAEEDNHDQRADVFGENAGAKSENGDWRNTVFIPRPGAQTPAPVAAPNNYGAVQLQNGALSNGNGHVNPGYARDTRQRQGY